MDAVSGPNASQHAAKMSFPTDLTSLRQGTKDYPAIEKENTDGDQSRAPAMFPKRRSDKVGDNPVNEGAGTDVDDRLTASFIPADEPGAQTAEYPDDRQGDSGTIFAIPKEQNQKDEKGQGIGQQMFKIGM